MPNQACLDPSSRLHGGCSPAGRCGWYAAMLVLLALSMFPVAMASEADDAKLAKIVASLKGEEAKVSEVKQQADRKAAAAYVQARAKLVSAASAALKKSLEGNDDPAFKAKVYKSLLNLDPSEAEACAFFKAVGNLEEVLAEAARNPILPPVVHVKDPADKPGKRETIAVSAVNSERMAQVFKLRDPFLVNGDCIRFYDMGGLTLQDTPTGSFTIRFTRGNLDKLEEGNAVTTAFDKPRFQIRGIPVLTSVHGAISRTIGVSVLEELLVSFNAETGAYAIFSDSGVVIKEGKITPRKGAPLFDLADCGNQPWGSQISTITLSQAPHPLVMKKP